MSRCTEVAGSIAPGAMAFIATYTATMHALVFMAHWQEPGPDVKTPGPGRRASYWRPKSTASAERLGVPRPVLGL